jgi:hypothetical protein
LTLVLLDVLLDRLFCGVVHQAGWRAARHLDGGYERRVQVKVSDFSTRRIMAGEMGDI